MNRILLLDDDVLFSQLVSAKLAEAGYEVKEAYRSIEGERMSRQYEFDLMIVDGLLPDGNGIDFVEKIRRKGVDTPVVFVTAFWRDYSTFKYLTGRLDVALVLDKPVTPNELLVQIEAVLKAHDGGPRLATRHGKPLLGLPGGQAAPGEDGAAPELEPPLVQPTVEIVEAEDGAELEGEVVVGLGDEPGEDPGEGAPAEHPDDQAYAGDDELAGLRGVFLEELDKRLGLVRTHLEAARAAGDDAGARDALDALRRVAHKIHGTAAMYGFGRVGAICGDVELCIVDTLAEEPPRAELPWDRLTTWVEQAEASFRAAAPQPAAAHAAVATILVVDADPHALSQVETLGQGLLIEILTATHPEAALEVLGEHRIDGALLDTATGGDLDAFGLARELRERFEPGKLPIGFVSDDASVANRVAAAHAGGSMFVAKPASDEQLTTVLRELAAERNAERPLVLVVDDDEEYVERVSTLLRGEDLRVEVLEEPERILETLERTRPQLLMLEVILPRLSGFDVCRMLRASPDWRDLPILFLTGYPSDELRLACFESGGDDYIDKSSTDLELLARTSVRLERARLRREHSTRDALTGLLNRKEFVQEFRKKLDQSLREGRPLSLGLLEIDGFRHLNESEGPLVGDGILQRCGRVISRRFRVYDLAARWAGGEFVVAVTGEDGETAGKILERLLAELGEVEHPGASGPLAVELCAGVASFPRDGSSIEELARAAGERVERSRQRGPGHVDAG